jgi:hypothetical protein
VTSGRNVVLKRTPLERPLKRIESSAIEQSCHSRTYFGVKSNEIKTGTRAGQEVGLFYRTY